ncbi:MAG: tetratricopeptide repeat protein, partial [Ignavibacteriales bacterium]|nr:tetratricopeptide repeat protein [Ignavibacteriales bacterium]
MIAFRVWNFYFAVVMNELHIIDQLRQARDYAEQGKSLHAIQIYRQLCSSIPELDEAWFELAGLYAASRQPDAVEKVLLSAIERGSNSAEFQWRLAMFYMMEGRTDKATRLLRRLEDRNRLLSPRLKALLQHSFGQLRFEQGKLADAEQHFLRVVRLDSEFPHIHEWIAEVQLARKKHSLALKSARVAQHAHAESWRAFYLEGKALVESSRWAEAAEAFESSIDRNPDEATLWHACGVAWMKLRQLEKARRYITKALQLNP